MASIAEICESADWSWVPPTIGSLSLVWDQEDTKTAYKIFHYENEQGWKWEALYDKEVSDYTVRIVLPLFDFTDISFVRDTFEPYWKGLQERMVRGVTDSLIESAHMLTYGYTSKGIHTWTYDSFLPPTVGDYVRDIAPDAPICMINGSYVIAEYVKPGDASGLILFYNTLREEFFAELRRHNIPEIDHRLDAKNLGQLEEVLQQNLEKVLNFLDERL